MNFELIVKIKTIKKVLKIFLSAVSVILLLLIVLWSVLQLHSVQTYFAQKAAEYLSDELNAKIQIEKLEVDFFTRVHLKNFYVEDQEEDTLAYLESLVLSVGKIDLDNKKLGADLLLQKARFNLYKAKGSEVHNIKFISDYFNQTDSSETKSDWEFTVNQIKVNQGKFSYHDYNEADSSNGINYDHIEVKDLNLLARDFKFDKLLSVKVDSLSLIESNQFKLDQFAVKFTLSDEVMDFKDLSIETAQSDIHTQYRMTANSLDDYKDFIQNVYLSADFRPSIVNTNDLAYFVPNFENLNQKIMIQGKVNGTVDNLSGNKVKIELNEQTYLNGDFDLRGLPNVKETFMFINVNSFATTASGIRALPLSPDNSFKIPETIDRLGIILFKGNFSGFINDFVAYGEFNSQLGAIKTDLSLSETATHKYRYKGTVQSKNFDLGSLFQIDKLGTLGLDVSLEGTGLELKTLKANAHGTIKSLDYADYTYDDIYIDGELSNGNFLGLLSIQDPNLRLNFEGAIKKVKKKLNADFTLDLYHANLNKLKLTERIDSTSRLSLKSDIDIDFSSVDDLEGSLKLDSIHYKDAKYELSDKEMLLQAINLDNGKKISLKSSFVNAELKGNYNLSKLSESYLDFLSYYLPNYKSSRSKEFQQEFAFEATVLNIDTLSKIILPELKLDSNLKLSASLNQAMHNASVRLRGNKLAYGNQQLDTFDFRLFAIEDSITQELNASRFSFASINHLDSFNLNSSLKEGKLTASSNWNSAKEILDHGELNFTADFATLDSFDVQFYKTFVNINDSAWSLVDSNKVEFRNKELRVENFILNNANQSVEVQGAMSYKLEDTLKLRLNQLDLSYISLIFEENPTEMKGIANGRMSLANLYKSPVILSELDIKGLNLNQVEIGHALLSSIWSAEEEALNLSGKLGEGENKKVEIRGKYFPKKQENSLDLKVEVQDLPIILIEPYLSDYLNDFEGKLYGSVDINGKPSEPLLGGKIFMDNAGITVNYLNTHYKVHDYFFFESDFIGFDIVEIEDPYGNKATATGTIFHNNYEDFNLDIGIDYTNFLALNTSSKDNELFYGKAFASGTANFSGFADQMIININAKGLKGTEFNIPLSEEVEVSNSDFLIFTNSPKNKGEEEEVVDLTGIQMNFDLEIEKEAKVKIIFDEQIGDVLEALGEGNLKLEINTLGNFNIYGQYVIDQGDYLFTLKNVISKKFQLAKGSRISWNGDPYEAKIDMQAIYNLRAPLADIMPADSTGAYKRRMPVELELQMTNYLLSPEIAFDIRLPNADDQTRQRLQSILYVNQNEVNEQEMNQQVFGLLFLNRFLPPTTGTAQASTQRSASGVNNGFELLSNQMSSWLSKISDQFDVGVNYRQGNEFAGDEVDLSLSTELFEDRLVLDGNFGYASNNQVNNDQQNNFIGEFTVEYKLSKDGRLRLSGFNRSVNNNLLQTVSPYTQGIGLFYREEFDSFDELWRRYFNSSKSKSSQAN